LKLFPFSEILSSGGQIMENLDINDLLPQPVTFEIKGKEFAFRQADLDDNSWIKSRFGEEGLKLDPSNPLNIKVLCEVWFRFLCDEYKPLFKPRKVLKFNEKTNKNDEVLLTSHELLGKIIGANDIPIVMKAFLKAMGLGDYTEEQLEKMGEDYLKKNKPEKKQTGAKSSTR
jgi:hypothetical protein